jgi:hypothetical protein
LLVPIAIVADAGSKGAVVKVVELSDASGMA